MEINISIIIVSYNTEELICECVKSIYDSHTTFSYEIIVVDNNSTDNTVSRLRNSFADLIIIECAENKGFSAGNNIGIEKARGKYFLLLNSDTILVNDSLEFLLKSALLNNYEITGPVLLNPDSTVQRSWFNFPSPIKIFLRFTDIYLVFYKLSKSIVFRIIFYKEKPAFLINEISEDRKMDYLSFACVLIRKDVFERIGMLDEGLLFYHEDCDYGLRAAKNNISFNYCVSSKIIHYGGMSSRKQTWFAFENDIKGLLYIYKKHYPASEFNKVRRALLFAIGWRKIFLNFGFYRTIRGIGLYEKEKMEKEKTARTLTRKKYLELIETIKNYD